MKKLLLTPVATIATSWLILLLAEVQAQPLTYASSGERVRNKFPFAGGTFCCSCKVKHYGNLPEDFPSGKVEAKYSVKFDFVGAGPLLEPGKIAGTLPTGQKLREKVLKTAVVEFSERGDLGIKDAGANVAEWLTTALNKTGVFEVYERLSLNKLMEEHKLGMSGLLEEETIARIGKMRGVQVIVTGSVIKFGDVISVTAKLIDTETGRIIDSGDIKVSDVNGISFQIGKLALELATQ